MVVDASVHELIVQNVEESEDECQLEEKSSHTTMGELLEIPISMLVASLPSFQSVPTTSPLLLPLGPYSASIVGSSTLMGEPKMGHPLENLHGIGSRLNEAQPRIGINPIVEKGKGLVYADSV